MKRRTLCRRKKKVNGKKEKIVKAVEDAIQFAYESPFQQEAILLILKASELSLMENIDDKLIDSMKKKRFWMAAASTLQISSIISNLTALRRSTQARRPLPPLLQACTNRKLTLKSTMTIRVGHEKLKLNPICLAATSTQGMCVSNLESSSKDKGVLSWLFIYYAHDPKSCPQWHC
uniref:Uncharacterized protein n=1 Tax=Cucumis melo TaxID=3656 RepID=A0A9I9EK90_CUCME